MEKQIVSLTKFFIHFVIGFLVYELLVDILGINIIFGLILKSLEKNAILLDTNVIIVISFIILHFISIFLSVNSLTRKYELKKEDKNNFIIGCVVLFIIYSLIYSYLNFVLSNDKSVDMFLYYLILNVIILEITVIYIRYKIMKKISDKDVINNENNNFNTNIVGYVNENNNEIKVENNMLNSNIEYHSNSITKQGKKDYSIFMYIIMFLVIVIPLFLVFDFIVMPNINKDNNKENNIETTENVDNSNQNNTDNKESEQNVDNDNQTNTDNNDLNIKENWNENKRIDYIIYDDSIDSNKFSIYINNGILYAGYDNEEKYHVETSAKNIKYIVSYGGCTEIGDNNIFLTSNGELYSIDFNYISDFVYDKENAKTSHIKNKKINLGISKIESSYTFSNFVIKNDPINFKNQTCYSGDLYLLNNKNELRILNNVKGKYLIGETFQERSNK